MSEQMTEAQQNSFMEGFEEAIGHSAEEVGTDEPTWEEDSAPNTNEEMESIAISGENQPAENAFVTVRYNGEDITLSKEEAITAAQKGLNYDKLQARLQTLQTSGATHQEAGRMAQSFGAGPANRAYNPYREQNNLPPAMRLQQLEREAYMRKVEDMEKQSYIDFVRAYPDVKEFPLEVLTMLKQGLKPLEAYRTYENKQLKEALAMQGKKQQNLQSKVGSAGSEAEDEENDPFLVGFHSILSK